MNNQSKRDAEPVVLCSMCCRRARDPLYGCAWTAARSAVLPARCRPTRVLCLDRDDLAAPRRPTYVLGLEAGVMRTSSSADLAGQWAPYIALAGTVALTTCSVDLPFL